VKPTPISEQQLKEELRGAGFSTGDWDKTNFRIRSVPLKEFTSGGPGKDGIPAIDRPKFETVPQAGTWLDDREPVQVLQIDGDARAYPLQILIWHEIVNDVVGGAPVAITYCPLCNSAVVFESTLPDGRVLDFGTTGNLRFSDLVMYDRQTQSWWQQITGGAVVGDLTGTTLKFRDSPVVSWSEFKNAHPDGKVLSRQTGHSRPYGRNPYTGYDTSSPFLFRGPADSRLPAIARVATVEIGDEAVAFPFDVLEDEPVVHYTIGRKEIVVFFKKGTASALDDSSIARGRDVGATGVFVSQVAGRKATFRAQGGEFRDNETGSAWNLFGLATAGPLKGTQLTPVVHGNHFWFSWAVFKPNTVVYSGR